MKKIFFLLIVLFNLMEIACLQSKNNIPENIKQSFSGTWICKKGFATNTIEIKFEKDTIFTHQLKK